MFENSRVVGRRRRAWPSTARSLAVIVATASLVLLAAACGGSSGSHLAQIGSTTSPSSFSSNPPVASAQGSGALAFSSCMRSNGVSNFPDSDSSGALPKVSLQRLGVSSSAFQAAENACRHVLPNGGSGPTQPEVQQVLNGMRNFSECMRAHGVAGWPDPANGSRGPFFNLLNYHGIDPGSPQFQAAERKCQHLMPSQFNGNVPVEQPS